MRNLNEKAIELLNRLPDVSEHIEHSRVALDLYSNNAVMYRLDGRNINWFFSIGKTREKTIDTRTARRTGITKELREGRCLIDVSYRGNGLTLTQHFEIPENKPWFTVSVTLKDGKQTESNCLIPMDFGYPADICDGLFLSLEQKMILVPYDNDMWVHYESAPLRPGRTSYDVSAVYNDRTLAGLLVGALDFDIWKNAVRCSAWDARCFSAISGVADSCSHDLLPHGFVSGEQVTSARFLCGWYEDIRDGFEEYGLQSMSPEAVWHWDHGVPYGWNSYSALTLHTSIDHYNRAADFLYEKLPAFHSKEGITYINFDAVFGIPKRQIRESIRRLHARGQKAGWYMNPLSHLPIQDIVPLRGNKLKHRKDILLKTEDGADYPMIDGKYPIDITIPEAEEDFRLALREFVEMGFDYIKLDFLSHGAVEGKRYDSRIRTGREALNYFYRIVREELSPEKTGREIFISSSIDPHVPCGNAHSRRCCCDSFGHHDDVKYVLNALTYGWWTNRTNYQFNDPDHTVLYSSMVDGREPSSENEARSRYNASVISGTVMLLSDNFGPDGDAEIIANASARAAKFADNSALNAVASRGRAFRPLTLASDANVFYSGEYLAVFNYEDRPREFEVEPEKINFPREGTLTDLNRNTELTYSGKILVTMEPYDSAIFSLKKI